jgi:two-component system sensor histidine kinase AlgZ
MHPILGQLRRLAVYLVAWIPLAGLLTYLLAVPGELSWSEAAVVSIPLCLVYAFVCLSAWYSCRVTPLEQTPLPKLLLSHLTAALVASGLWVLAAKLFALELSGTASFQGLDIRLSKDLPLLLGTGILLYLLSVAFYYVLLAVEASREAEAREMKASVLARDAELKALKAQVNPHFIFNSLHSISALTSSDSAKAREMCILLADFLRRTLGLGEKSAITLEEEISLIRCFLAVEKVRFGARLRMEEDYDKGALNSLVPPLLLQPLVENAIAHGIGNMPAGGCVRLLARCRDDFVIVTIENSFDPEAPSSRGNGMGLANVRQRLAAHYGNRARFDVKAEADFFRVVIAIPAEREAARA